MLFPIWFFLSLVARQSHSLVLRCFLIRYGKQGVPLDLNYIIIRAVQGERPLDGRTCWHNYRPSDWRLSEVVLILVVRFWFCAAEDAGDKDGEILCQIVIQREQVDDIQVQTYITILPIHQYKNINTMAQLQSLLRWLSKRGWMLRRRWRTQNVEDVIAAVGSLYAIIIIVLWLLGWGALWAKSTTTNTIIWMHGIDFNECMDTEGGVAYSTAGHSTR